MTRIKLFSYWCIGYTGFKDSNNTFIFAGDFTETYDNTGKRWTAFIKRRIFKGYSSDGLNLWKWTFVFVFASNYDTWLHENSSKDFTIIKTDYQYKFI